MIVGQVFNLPVQIPRESHGAGRLKTCPTKQQQPGGQEAVGLWWINAAGDHYFAAVSKTANALMRKTFAAMASLSP